MTTQTTATTTAAAILDQTAANMKQEATRGQLIPAINRLQEAEKAHEAARENGNAAAIERTAAGVRVAKKRARKAANTIRTYNGLNTPEGYAAAPQRIREAWERMGGTVTEEMREAAQRYAAAAHEAAHAAMQEAKRAEAAAEARLDEAERELIHIEDEAEYIHTCAEALEEVIDNEATRATWQDLNDRAEAAEAAHEAARKALPRPQP